MGKHLAPQTPPSAPAGRTGAVRTVGLALGIGLVFIAAVVAGVSLFTHQSFIRTLAAPLAPAPQDLFHKDNILVLVEGLDYDYSSKDEEYSTQARSDVIWAVNMDFAHNKIYQLSIPRDMDATLPNGRESKINQAQSDGGTPEAEAVIAKWLGIPPFDRYVVLRINTAKDLIDAIGGVDVNVQNSDPTDKSPMVYDDNWGHLHIHLKPGLQHLNGDQAVGYMRFRHDFCGDPCRIKRQQQVLHALVGKIKSNKLNTMLHAGDLINVFNRDVSTNFTHDEEVSVASAFLNLQPGDLKTAQVPYVDTKTLGDFGEVIIPDENAKYKLVQNMLIAPPQPTAPPSPGSLAQVAPSSVKVDVENGTGIPGLAKKIAAALKAKGFAIGDVGNAPATVDTTEVHQHSTVALAGAKVLDALGSTHGTVVTDSPAPAGKSDVTVVVGRDLAAAYAAQASAAQ